MPNNKAKILQGIDQMIDRLNAQEQENSLTRITVTLNKDLAASLGLEHGQMYREIDGISVFIVAHQETKRVGEILVHAWQGEQ